MHVTEGRILAEELTSNKKEVNKKNSQTETRIIAVSKTVALNLEPR
jgi:hypothetical protein